MKVNQTLRRTLLAAIIGLVGVAGTSVGFTAPAHAGPVPYQITPYQNVWSGFSLFGLDSRNFTMSIVGATPNDTSTAGVWFGAQDLTTHVWYGGWTGTDGTGAALVTVADIPQSSCGHTFRFDATDWHDDQGAPTDAPEVTGLVDTCGPILGVNRFPQPIIGNGFTPGARVVVTIGATGATQKVTASSFVIRNQPFLLILPGGNIATTLVPGNCERVSAAYASKPSVIVAAFITPCI